MAVCPGTGTTVGQPNPNSLVGSHMPRVNCPVCGKSVGQKRDGTVNKHKPKGEDE